MYTKVVLSFLLQKWLSKQYISHYLRSLVAFVSWNILILNFYRSHSDWSCDIGKMTKSLHLTTECKSSFTLEYLCRGFYSNVTVWVLCTLERAKLFQHYIDSPDDVFSSLFRSLIFIEAVITTILHPGLKVECNLYQSLTMFILKKKKIS